MSQTAIATTRRDGGAFLRTRLGSLLAVLPLAVWTIVHLWENLAAFQGPAAWQHAVTEYDHPIGFFVSATIALLPLAIHTVWGIGRLFTTQPNNVRYGYFANTKYVLQRLSAIGVLLFLGAHIWLALLHPRMVQGGAEPFADIAHEMRHHTPTLVVYILGILGVAYHLANGLATFTMSWGLVSSRRALKKLDLWAILLFVIVLGMGWGAVYALWSAGA